MNLVRRQTVKEKVMTTGGSAPFCGKQACRCCAYGKADRRTACAPVAVQAMGKVNWDPVEWTRVRRRHAADRGVYTLRHGCV